MKRKLIVIGIGAGNPEYVTIQAVKAMNRATVFFIPNKESGKEGLADVRRDICERYVENPGYRFVEFSVPKRIRPKDNYTTGIDVWRDEVEAVFEQLLANELNEDECGAFLIWGDPSLYDSTLRNLENIRKRGNITLDYEVIPGITSVQALAARHKTTLNLVGQSVHITTGRRMLNGFPDGVNRATVMLDADKAFTKMDGDTLIYWGAYVGTKDEILVSGKIRDVSDEIESVREKAREEHGWIMDSYILSKPDQGEG